MRGLFTITVFFCCPFIAGSQVSFKTVIPQQSVTAGESFQVQYIIEDGKKISNFIAPVFSNFRVVTGPNIYEGSAVSFGRTRQLRNTVYTLEAIKPGQFVIPGAAAAVNGEWVRSPDAVITIITPEEAMKRFDRETGVNSEYFLRPGEDPYRKIRENLFLKVMVDKKSCFTGEAILATFKLYSRLESKSDIVKNPGFYGFTVHDMVNLADRMVTTESVNGKIFDVHTIRKVELFPLQAGIYTIDPMEIKNVVEFSRSAVNRKTEQEIVEGVLHDDGDEPVNRNAVVFETDMRTEPVTIHVKPVPVLNKPPGYDGALGSFSITVSLSDSSLAKNEEGHLEILINGEGNFIQLNAPTIQWPAAVEGFEPRVSDVPGKYPASTTGSRRFSYAFVSSTPGQYQIPAIAFSYFNPDSGVYKTIRSKAIVFQVSNQEKPVLTAKTTGVPVKDEKRGNWLLPVLSALFLSGLAIWLIRFRRKVKPVPVPAEVSKPAVSVEELLAPAQSLVQGDDKLFYASLRQGICNFFAERYGISGSEMSKEAISGLLQEQRLNNTLATAFNDILQLCETGMYTNATLHPDKTGLVEKTKKLLGEISPALL